MKHPFQAPFAAAQQQPRKRAPIAAAFFGLLLTIASIATPVRADPLQLMFESGVYVILDGHVYFMQPGEMDVWVGVYWARASTSMANCHRANNQPQLPSTSHLTYSSAPGAYVYLDDRLSAWPLAYEFGVSTLTLESKTHDIVCDYGEVMIPGDLLYAGSFE